MINVSFPRSASFSQDDNDDDDIDQDAENEAETGENEDEEETPDDDAILRLNFQTWMERLEKERSLSMRTSDSK